MWLGSTPVVPYTEKRVHPQAGYDRPGWLRCEQFGAGMITGWGAHHIDSAHWGMDTEYTGPVEMWGSAEFPAKGLWDVHGPFRDRGALRRRRQDDRQRRLPERDQVHRHRGLDLRLARQRDGDRERSGLEAARTAGRWPRAIRRSSRRSSGPTRSTCTRARIITATGSSASGRASSRSRPVEVAHRACSACLLHHMAMKTKRKLYWDPVKERFKNDDEANAMLSRPQRPPYTLNP